MIQHKIGSAVFKLTMLCIYKIETTQYVNIMSSKLFVSYSKFYYKIHKINNKNVQPDK